MFLREVKGGGHFSAKNWIAGLRTPKNAKIYLEGHTLLKDRGLIGMLM